MNHSQAASSDLIDFVNELHRQHVKPTCDGWVASLVQMRAVSLDHYHPLDRAFIGLAGLILAAEVLEDVAKHVKAAARDKLAASMAEHGSPGFYTQFHHVHPVEVARGVIVTDAAALAKAHPDLMTVPVPKLPAPDTTAIGARLRKKQIVTGATLDNGPPKPSVRFSPLAKKGS